MARRAALTSVLERRTTESRSSGVSVTTDPHAATLESSAAAMLARRAALTSVLERRTTESRSS
ncbi:MAG: hypothetical protein AABM42_02125, partial [Actinomycetota bacterium]